MANATTGINTTPGNGGMNDVGITARETSRELKDSARDVKQDVSRLASNIKTEAKAKLADASQSFDQYRHEAMNMVQTQVRSRPGMTLGIAAAVGVLVGLMLAGGRR
jgi:ElaB/YqjD/DUF883 family membrane-anchored ribosome-binding protein